MSVIRRILALMACALTLISSHAVPIRRGPGMILPESVMPTDRDNPALWNRHTAARFTTKGAPPGEYATNNMNRIGKVEFLVVLAEFPNRPFRLQDTTALRNRYERMFNGSDYTDTVCFHGNSYVTTGSVSNYFKSQSYGKFEPVFRIVGPIRTAYGYETYGKDINRTDANGVERLVKEMCDSLSKMGINLADFDQDGDGNLENLSIIFAGRGQNYDGGEENAIWPQASLLQLGRYNVNELNFMCTCELCWDSDSVPDGIGTFCHEFSHTLGLPDYYISSNNPYHTAMGYWSLMDYGTYENEGFSPVGYTAFEKYSLGWLDIEEIIAPGSYWLSDISREPDPDADIHTAYRINSEEGNENRFIILENHNRNGWYKYHKSEGLMVTVVSYSASSWMGNTVNQSSSSKRYYLLPADNDYNRYSNAGDLYPYMGNDSITPTSTPKLATILYKLFNIERKDSIVTFTVSDRYTAVNRLDAPETSIDCIDGTVRISAPANSCVEIFDISGRRLVDTLMPGPLWQYRLPGQGIYIVRCAGITKKVRN